MTNNTLRKSWISGTSLAAVLLVSGVTTAEARILADDHTAGHQAQTTQTQAQRDQVRNRDQAHTRDNQGRVAHDDESRGAGEVINDTWITTKVKSQLLADGDVSGFDVSVETRDNVVHLSGAVENQSQIDQAVAIARDTEGVARVDSSALRIDTAARQMRDGDRDNRDRNRNTGAAATGTSTGSTGMTGRDGGGTRTTGQGTMGTASGHAEAGDRTHGTGQVGAQTGNLRQTGGQAYGERDTTRDATTGRTQDRTTHRNTADRNDNDRGAGEVINDAWITTKVNSKLAADGTVSVFDLSVETRDNVVHLSGEVENQAQRDIAVRLARETEGVTNVQADGLRIVATDARAQR